MMQTPSPEGDSWPGPQIPGQLSLWDQDTAALAHAVRDGFTALVVDDEVYERAPTRRQAKGP